MFVRLARNLVLPFLCLLVSGSAVAASPQEDSLLKWKLEVLPKFYFNYSKDVFEVEGGVMPFTYIPVENRADEKAVALVLLPWEDRAEFYPVLSDELNKIGVSVIFVEWLRESWGGDLLPFRHDNYVQFLDEFVADLREVYLFKGKLIGIGSSLGANMLLQYVHDSPESLDLVVVSSPIFGVNAIPGVERSLQKAIAQDFVNKGKGNQQILGRKRWFPPENYDVEDLKSMNMTHDLGYALALYMGQKGRTYMRKKGYTYAWLLEMLSFSEVFSDNYLRFIETATLFGIPTEDNFSSPALQKKACDVMVNCSFYLAEGARHNLLREAYEYRSGWMDVVKEYINENL